MSRAKRHLQVNGKGQKKIIFQEKIEETEETNNSSSGQSEDLFQCDQCDHKASCRASLKIL